MSNPSASVPAIHAPVRTWRTRSAGLVSIAVIILALGALGVGAWEIGVPGLYYDEVLFVDAALGQHQGGFITAKFFGLPVLLMPYIGALKAWIYAPIFALFGVNEWTIRLPALLLALGGVAATVEAARRLFGTPAALVAAGLMFFDPTLLMHSRLDWGPNAIMFLCRGLLLLGLAGWWQTKQPRWLWLAFGALGAGIFDKLNFLWLAYGALGALLVVAPGRLRELHQRHRRHAQALLALAAVVLVVATVRAVALSLRMTEGGSPATWGGRWLEALHLLRLTLLGGGPFDFIAGDGRQFGRFIWPAYAGLVAVALVGATRAAHRPSLRAWGMMAIFALGTTGMFIVTKSATGPHHAAVIAGLPALLLAPFIAACIPAWTTLAATLLSRTAVAGVALFAAGAMIDVNLRCIAGFHVPRNANWDPANSAVADFAAEHPKAHFVIADWGMGNQLIALTAGRVSLNDRWPKLIAVESAHGVLSSLDPSRDTYFVWRSDGRENFPAAKAGLRAAANAQGHRFETIRVLDDVAGRPLIEIVRLQRARQP